MHASMGRGCELEYLDLGPGSQVYIVTPPFKLKFFKLRLVEQDMYIRYALKPGNNLVQVYFSQNNGSRSIPAYRSNADFLYSLKMNTQANIAFDKSRFDEGERMMYITIENLREE